MGKNILELLVFLFISLVILKVINSNLVSTPCMLWLCRTDSKQTAVDHLCYQQYRSISLSSYTNVQKMQSSYGQTHFSLLSGQLKIKVFLPPCQF